MITERDIRHSRRDLLRQAFAAGGLWGASFFNARLLSALTLSAQTPRDGTFLGVVPFSEEGHPPMGKPIGSELDGRLFTDLSGLNEEHPVAPSQEFFIRTRASKLLDTFAPWTVQVSSTSSNPQNIAFESLRQKSRSMGVHLMECSGNTRAAHFGMMSVADWEGVPLQEIIAMLKPQKPVARVHIVGFDRYSDESETSIAGASWIFSPDQLFSANAFLAIRMNGQALSPDHGAPVRLVVPGWYGCASIKWVKQIEWVPDDAPATSQMQEYAGRTMQDGVPALARDYRPAMIGAAALPIRIEKWRVGGRIRYQVIGLQWGNLRPKPELEIRFSPDEGFAPVENHPPSGSDSWAFWRKEWVPGRPGRFTIRLRLRKMLSGTERLDAGYYDRSADISEI